MVLWLLVVDVLVGVVVLTATVVDGVATEEVVVVADSGVESTKPGSDADTAVGD